MARSRAFARYLFRLKHQRRYSFTRTKMIIGFFVSLFCSIVFGTYIEANGIPILKQTYRAIVGETEPSNSKQAQDNEVLSTSNP